MPAERRSLTSVDVYEYIGSSAFSTTGNALGAELELIPFLRADPGAGVPHEVVLAAVDERRLYSTISYEPGGQIELSTPPVSGIAEACATVSADLKVLRSALGPQGISLEGVGLDPIRKDRRVLNTPRYAAMERYFDSGGPAGRRMMCRTAAIQLNLDAGPVPDERWRLAHATGPVLAAAFANSPFIESRVTPWRSARLATWWAMDQTRTSPVPESGSAAQEWARYALDANVMLIRAGEDHFVPVVERLPFARWIDNGHDLGYPTIADLEYHLTTLFPPIRARGWLELRMIDAQQDPWWRAAIAVPAALLYDAEASARARRACAGLGDLWFESFTDGHAHPDLAAAARECFDAALDALTRLDADAATVAATAEFTERHVRRGRCPADDALDHYRAAGEVPPFRAAPARVRG